MAVGPVVEGRAQRDVWFEVNGEVRAVSVEDKSSAVETISREKATSEPGSVGAPMSGVVVEVRVKEGQEIKKGDPLCVMSAMKVCVCCSFLVEFHSELRARWSLPLQRLSQDISNVLSSKKVSY